MITIICGTNRRGSRSLAVGRLVLEIYQGLGVEAELLDLASLPLDAQGEHQYSAPHPQGLQDIVSRVNSSDGLVMICPEYNGSYPGILKYFIDHWSYPETFEHRPVSYIGLGGRFGGLRPVEHLQQVFGYRNSYSFPVRVFLFNVWDLIKNGKLEDEGMIKMLQDQAHGFLRFVRALRSEGLDANSVRQYSTSK